MGMDNRKYQPPHERSVLREQETLAAKLVAEISQLERWLDAQSRAENARGSSVNVSLIPTIRTLLETRRKLLNSIEPYLY